MLVHDDGLGTGAEQQILTLTTQGVDQPTFWLLAQRYNH